MSAEQRREPRYACDHRVRVEAPSGDLSGQLENVSDHGGMLTVGGTSPESGQKVRVVIAPSATRASVVVDADVCWASEVIPGLVGIRLIAPNEGWSALVREASGA